MQFDLLGNPIEKNEILREKFIEPPFSILDTRSGSWLRRRKKWDALGMNSKKGFEHGLTYNLSKGLSSRYDKMGRNEEPGPKLREASTFDPALAELLYHWFCEPGGWILDPFAGGPTTGIIAHYLGFKYIGLEIRPEQIAINNEVAIRILGESNCPAYVQGNSNATLDGIGDGCIDFIISCPPYADLVRYSKIEGDISNMKYPEFLQVYKSIIKKCIDKLKPGCFCAFIVGEVRGKDGGYIGFVPDTIEAFRSAGAIYYNEAVLLNQCGSAALRAGGNMKSKKLVKIHQNVLIFKKP